jgi:hypothetical protein
MMPKQVPSPENTAVKKFAREREIRDAPAAAACRVGYRAATNGIEDGIISIVGQTEF